MKRGNMNEKEISDIVRSQLKKYFPLFKEEHEVRATFYEEKILIGYRTNPHWNPWLNTF